MVTGRGGALPPTFRPFRSQPRRKPNGCRQKLGWGKKDAVESKNTEVTQWCCFFFLYSKERVQFSRFVKAGERIAWFSQCSLTLTHTAHLTPSLERFLWPWLPCFCFCLCLLIREQFHFKTLGALFREILSFFLLQSFSFLLCFISVGRKKRRQIHL